MVDWILNGAFGWVADVVQGVLSWLMGLLAATLFTSPDMTRFPQVQALADRSLLVVNAVFGLVIVTAGLLTMISANFQVQYELKQLIPRLVFAFQAANFGDQICHGVIVFANAVTQAVMGQAASGPRVVSFVSDRLRHSAWDPTTRPVAVIITLLIAVMLIQLLASWVGRVVTLFILAGTAPAALASYALPQTQAVADLWWKTLLGTLTIPLLQGMAFSTGVDLLLDPDHNLAVSAGLPVGSDLLNLFLIACLLVITIRIPRLVARYVSSGPQGRGPVGVLVRTVAIAAVTRRIRFR